MISRRSGFVTLLLLAISAGAAFLIGAGLPGDGWEQTSTADSARSLASSYNEGAADRAEGELVAVNISGPWQDFDRPSDEQLRERLGPLQFRVTRQNGTEPAYDNVYWDNHDEGIYVDVVSGEPLFSSLHKYESGTGWPSFTQPLVAEFVTEHEDRMLGIQRTEVRSSSADSHLGHVFNDGPDPTGLRYCINSAALRFVPVESLEEEGYGELASAFDTTSSLGGMMDDTTETATFAGGCFWGMEAILRDIPGVLDTEVGYTGGTTLEPTYRDITRGESGHAESVQVVFDPAVVTYDELLAYFFRMHDPTTFNRQGNDVGDQYRSAIFYHNDAQRETAERIKVYVDNSGKWNNPVVTSIEPVGPFYDAEDYHQDYLVKNPNGYTCHYLRE